ncbi:MAG: hypothetical protein V3T72_15985 [Thermoanaerobaculia bacterium]
MTKRTLEALERTDFVVTSIRTQKPTVTAELTRTFGDDLPEGGLMPDWDGLQETHAARLAGSARAIRGTEQHHRRNAAEMSGYRKQRHAIVNRLLRGYRDLRNSVEGTYPEEALTVIGLEEQPIRRFVAVREQMPEVLERLRDPELQSRMPEPLAGHQALDFDHFAGAMAADIELLEGSMETIRQMQKILDESLLAKREALKDNRRTYLYLARIQEGYYRLAGLDDLADRIRTEVFRLSPRKKEAPAEPPAEAASSASSPAAEPPGAAPSTAAPLDG